MIMELSLKEIADKRLNDAPDGHLRITYTRKSHVQYMHTEHGSPEKVRGKRCESFIRKDNSALVIRLAQKDYDERINKLVNRRIKKIDRLCSEYQDNEIEEIYNCLHPIRKSLIQPVEKTWGQQLDEWKNIPYVGKGFDPATPEIVSKKGERVRSKSEKIIADTLLGLGIEYKYECPLELRGYGTVYPDFTILRKRDCKEIYWEHDGRMDDPSYAEKAIRKINSYIENNYFPGNRLILSFETKGVVLNDRTIMSLINEHIL